MINDNCAAAAATLKVRENFPIGREWKLFKSFQRQKVEQQEKPPTTKALTAPQVAISCGWQLSLSAFPTNLQEHLRS